MTCTTGLSHRSALRDLFSPFTPPSVRSPIAFPVVASFFFLSPLVRELGAVKLLSALDLCGLLNGGDVGRAGDNIRRVGVSRCPGHAVLVVWLQSVGPSSVVLFSFLGDLIC